MAALSRVEGGDIDYPAMDYLAKTTMATLQKQGQRNPDAGFATSFLVQLRDVPATAVVHNITVISNAEGVSPFRVPQRGEAAGRGSRRRRPTRHRCRAGR